MKTNNSFAAYRLLTCCFFCFTFAACEETLVEDPKTFLDKDITFSSEEGAVAATLGVYQSLRAGTYYGQVLLAVTIQHSDYAYGRGSQVPSGNYQFDANTIIRVGTIWTSIYSSINRANIVLENVPQMDMLDPQLKTQLEAEALFLRALGYFNLVRLWGGVPLRLKPEITDFALGRATEDDVYAQIINDLQIAEENLPDVYPANENGRATKWAAKTLLANVYLTQERWSDAAAKAKEVLDSGRYSLVEVTSSLDFQTKLFGPDIPTNSEDIFSIKYSVTFDNDSFVRFFHKPEPGYSKGGPHAIIGNMNSFISQGEWESENTPDLRRNHTLYSGEDTQYLNASVPMLFRKFRGTQTNVSNNTPIFRLPEVLLIFAEAESQANSGPTAAAYNAINQVRRRAFGKDLDLPSAEADVPAGLNARQFRDAVMLERAKELLGEGGHRWFDLLRTGTVFDVIQAAKNITLTEKNLKWPIPQEELDNNDALTQADQNPGW